jgi:DNA recombination protein RmuC
METVMMMIVGMLLGAGVVLFLMRRIKPEPPKGDSEALMMLQRQMADLTHHLDLKLSENRRDMSDAVRNQFSESQKLLREISGTMQESLLDVAKEQTRTNESTARFMAIADQLANLEKVLKHQKQRGNLGEASLELILSNMLPPGGYKMQHRFLNNDAVDAIVLTKEGFIPVDAKFSLDNYHRVSMAQEGTEKEALEKEFKNDLKKRIDETAKYIRPEEGTLPFAFMFIPAEGIYYDLLVNEVGSVKVNTRSLIDYAYNDKKVIIVSPTTFSAYLQSVLYGFKAFKIEESARDIVKRVDELGKHLKAYEDYMVKLGNTLSTSVNHYNSAFKELGKLDKDVTRITGVSPGLSPVSLDKPTQGE